MIAFVVSLAGVLVVGGLLFLGGSLLLGRGETQPPADRDRSPVELPDDRPVVGDDVRALRISVAVRGYRMTEVDWLLDQFAQTLDERDEQLAALRAELERRPAPGEQPGAGADEGRRPEEPGPAPAEHHADQHHADQHHADQHHEHQRDEHQGDEHHRDEHERNGARSDA